MCSLVDMRFSQLAQDDEQVEHVTSADTLFGDCDVGNDDPLSPSPSSR